MMKISVPEFTNLFDIKTYLKKNLFIFEVSFR